MAIRQVNASYVPVEDRILLRVTMSEGDEYRFWLTRACLREFAPQATAWIAAADHAPAAAAVTAFKREAAAAQADFSTPMQQGENFPLGKTPLLVETLRLESAGAKAGLLLSLIDKRVVTLHLDENALAGVQRLLQQAISGADWALPTIPSVLASVSGKVH